MRAKLIKTLQEIKPSNTPNELNLDDSDLNSFLYSALETVMKGIKDPDLKGKTPAKFIKNLQNGKLGSYDSCKIFLSGNKNDLKGMIIGLEKSCDEFYICSLGIATEHRSKGLGNILLNQMMHYAHSKDYKTLSLHVHKENTPAVNLYKKLGFT